MFSGLDQVIVRSWFAHEIRELIVRHSPARTIVRGGEEIKRLEANAVGDMLAELHGLFRGQFSQYGHPLPLFNFSWTGAEDEGTCAAFSPSLWQVFVNPRLVGLQSGLSRLGAAVVARSIYHEMRHAEQYCLVIRYVWTTHPGASATDLCKRSLTGPGVLPPPANVVRALEHYPLDPGTNISRQDYELAGKFFQSSYRTVARVQKRTLKIGDPIDELELAETQAANQDLANANIYAEQVNSELVLWNKQKPATFIFGSLEVSIPEGQSLMALRFQKPLPGNFYSLGRMYLQARRERALDMLKESHREYMSVPLEEDAHRVEGKMAVNLKVSDGATYRVAQQAGAVKGAGFLPEPMWW